MSCGHFIHAGPLFQLRPNSAADLLVDLLAAVGTGDGGDGQKPLGGKVHKLLLQGPLSGAVGPGEPLIQVQQAEEAHGQHNNPPA